MKHEVKKVQLFGAWDHTFSSVIKQRHLPIFKTRRHHFLSFTPRLLILINRIVWELVASSMTISQMEEEANKVLSRNNEYVESRQGQMMEMIIWESG